MKLPIDIHEEGDTVTVEGPRARPFHERHRVEFDIAVPDALDVTVHLVRGDATAEGLSRPLAITTVKGDVRVTDCASIAVEGVSSDVDIQRPSGDIAVKIIRGDIAVGHASGDIAVTTKRGNITLRAHTVRRLDASTVRGDMTLMLERMAPGGTADMHTINGDVRVVLGPEVHCRLDATTVSGDISSRLPLQAASADACHVSGILGAPEATLRVRTTRGDIRLAQTTPSAAAPPA
ncbi:MAG: DUF4097 family beta strand repeat protein [Armatimonadetes bacterium]|nr:DUF4097 family beta strand repeat protein [Armatimonadota bacterium]